MKDIWYKIISILLILYSLIYGLLNNVPELPILNETIRNVYYHVPIWFAMLFQMGASAFFSVQYLRTNDLHTERKAFNAAIVGLALSVPGMITGAFWARFTWGTWWTFQDPKLNGVAIGILTYLIYFILRASVTQEGSKEKIASVFNIFSFVMLMMFIMIFPRLTDSLHPGNGGNPAFGKYDMDNNMRMVFYPAVIGWIFLSYWIFKILNSYSRIKQKLND